MVMIGKHKEEIPSTIASTYKRSHSIPRHFGKHLCVHFQKIAIYIMFGKVFLSSCDTYNQSQYSSWSLPAVYGANCGVYSGWTALNWGPPLLPCTSRFISSIPMSSVPPWCRNPQMEWHQHGIIHTHSHQRVEEGQTHCRQWLSCYCTQAVRVAPYHPRPTCG